MKKFLIALILPLALHTSNKKLSQLIKRNAKILKRFSEKDNPSQYNAYLELLKVTRAAAKNYVSQEGSFQELNERKQFLTKFNIVWKQYKSRLFSNDDIKVWAGNWRFVTQV